MPQGAANAGRLIAIVEDPESALPPDAERSVSRQTINALERGRYDPSLPLAFSISKVFALVIEDIFQPEL